VIVVKAPGYLVARETVAGAPRTLFAVYEPGQTWEDGSPRAKLEVTVQHPSDSALNAAEVGWSSTTNNRPGLARGFADALLVAADYAEALDAEALDAETARS
jgi:hypothetical protein